jgi:hypothetical protein
VGPCIERPPAVVIDSKPEKTQANQRKLSSFARRPYHTFRLTMSAAAGSLRLKMINQPSAPGGMSESNLADQAELSGEQCFPLSIARSIFMENRATR